MERIDFIKTGLITAAAPALILADIKTIKRSREPMVIPTWNHGIDANKEAMKVLNSNGSALDAVEEEVIKTVGSFLVVELMRQGYSPQDACKKALRRTVSRHNGNPKFQIAYIAMRKYGKIGVGAIRKGFKYSYFSDNKNKLHTVKGIIN